MMRSLSFSAPRLLTALSVAAAACAAGSSPASNPADADDDPCHSDDPAACIASTRRQCTAASQVHRIRYDTHPSLVVGPEGLVRLDHLGGRLYSTDATTWLACFQSCPDEGPTRLCFPLALPLRLAWPVEPACDEREVAAADWRGRPSRTLELSCPGGPSSLRVVPDLEPVADRLTQAGAIDPSDLLARVDGLVVEASAAGAAQSAVVELEPAACADLDLPRGYRVVGSASDFTALESAAAGPAAQLAAEVDKIRSAVMTDAAAQAKAELLPRFAEANAEACRARGHDPTTETGLEACAATTPQTEAPFRAAVAAHTARLLGERRAEIDALTSRLLVGPLCRHFSARADADDDLP